MRAADEAKVPSWPCIPPTSAKFGRARLFGADSASAHHAAETNSPQAARPRRATKPPPTLRDGSTAGCGTRRRVTPTRRRPHYSPLASSGSVGSATLPSVQAILGTACTLGGQTAPSSSALQRWRFGVSRQVAIMHGDGLRSPVDAPNLAEAGRQGGTWTHTACALARARRFRTLRTAWGRECAAARQSAVDRIA